MDINSGLIANIITLLSVFFYIGHYKGKVDGAIVKNDNLEKKINDNNEAISLKFDAQIKRLDSHGDDIVKLNTKAELSMTAKDVDDKYVSKELFRQFEKHIDGRFDLVQADLTKILNHFERNKG